MTRPDQRIHIADHAWDRDGIGCQYSVHVDNDGWIARKYSVRVGGAVAIEVEETAPPPSGTTACELKSSHCARRADWPPR